MIEKIMNSFDLLDIIDAINEFCREVNLRENDDICFELKERIGASDNDIHMLLAAYLSAAEDGDEVVDTLHEFMANCKGFNEQFIRTEIERYIPAAREVNMHTRYIFKRYFYDVLLYKEQKPQIYTHLDENMQRIFVVEVFRKLIEQYMKLKE